MDSTGNGSFLRNRRFDNFFNTSFDPNVNEPQKITVKKKEEVEFRPRTENEYVDDDGWFSALKSCCPTLVTLRHAEVLKCPCFLDDHNFHLGTDHGLALTVASREDQAGKCLRPCHWQTIGKLNVDLSTVGIAKKETNKGTFNHAQIIWYPLFGQLYVLAKHIRIDRSNPPSAIQSMKEVSFSFPCIVRLPFIYGSNSCLFSFSGSSGNCKIQPIFDNFSTNDHH
ncbi:hypothetical protein JRO89_XS15G0155200 [Xanthoceras sorbifolium]|uniref:Uncharacterized protein n=1 Tax=Xanthoceras sorbifolium TaxID=99658 RepID=A0ABQ8H2D6_9ROSI|nr:hypothetical protein JRO89_XS15G0155200 [Xanthoceras sorbifolium]